MNIEKELQDFQKDLSLHLKEVLDPQLCQEIIQRYDNSLKENSTEETTEKIFQETHKLIFTGKVDALLREYFQSDYQAQWPLFNVISSSDSDYYSARWHFDGGITNSFKLFIYLNPVSKHQGNTIMMDKKASEEFRKTGELSIVASERKEDLSELIKELNLTQNCFTYNLQTGDALLFSPILLAHRCVLPKEGEKRYTICFNISSEKVEKKIVKDGGI